MSLDVGGHFGRNLVVPARRGGAQEDLDVRGRSAELDHCRDGSADDTVAGAHAAGVGRGNDAGGVVRKQHGDAVRDEDSESEVRRGGHECIGGLDGAVLRSVDDGDGIGVELLHVDDVWEIQNSGEPRAVRGDVLGIIAHVGAQIEGTVRGRGNPAGTGGKYHADGAATHVWRGRGGGLVRGSLRLRRVDWHALQTTAPHPLARAGARG